VPTQALAATEVAEGMARWLRGRQSPDGGRIVDSIHQVSGTYADGFAALVFCLLGWSDARDTALKVSLARPANSEFDSLAQALILEVTPDSLTPSQRSALVNQSLYQGRALVSNNWALFRGLTRVLRSRLYPDFSVLQKQLPSGLFPDSPVGTATPVCYHAKICATLALLEAFRPQAPHRQALHRGLEALLHLVSPQGLMVPYGRSRNSLFGYGSAYLALRLGTAFFQDPRHQAAAEAILGRLRRYQHSDGHIPAILNENEWLRQDWDVYINNPDYNAFAAACLLLADRLVTPTAFPAPSPSPTPSTTSPPSPLPDSSPTRAPASSPASSPASHPTPSPSHASSPTSPSPDPSPAPSTSPSSPSSASFSSSPPPEYGIFNLGPILVCRHPRGYFACSTTGEFAPYGSPFFCDTRYAGLTPLCFDDGQNLRNFDENYCWDGRDSTRGCLVNPRISDYIPYLELNRQRYWVRLYGALTATLEGDVLSVSGSGLPLTSQPLPRWRRFLASWLQRGPTPQLQHQHLTTLFETTLSFDFATRKLLIKSVFPTSRAILQRGQLEETVCPT